MLGRLSFLFSGTRSFAAGRLHPVTLDDFHAVLGAALGDFHRIVCDVHRRLCDFIHTIVVHRRDEGRPDLVPPAPVLQCEPHLTPGGSGVLADPAKIDEEFRKAWLPYFCRSGKRDTSLEEFAIEIDRWLPVLPVVDLPRLTGEMLEGVVRRKSAAAGGLDGWGWRELKVLPVAWFDGLASIHSKVEEVGRSPDA